MKKKKKMLFMGIDSATAFALKYAKSQDVYTIITDNNTLERAPLKTEADEYWMISVGDIDLLERRCREQQVAWIFSGNHEFCLEMTKELCKRLGLPFYASDEGWAAGRDKARFKMHCIECGMDVAHGYHPDPSFQTNIPEVIKYPVVVKPADASSQKGFCICHNEEELKAGYMNALQHSQKGKVIVEEFIDGVEIDVIYYVHKGIPFLICMNDKLPVMVNDRMNQSILLNQSRYYDEYVNEMSDKINQFVERLEYKEGVMFLQAIRKDGKYYFLEMGCRMDGIGCWVSTKENYHFDYLECMVDLAMGRQPEINLSEINFSPKGKYSATYLYWARPGQVKEVVGNEFIGKMNGVTVAMSRFHPGDFVQKTDNLIQVGWFLEIVADNSTDLVDKIYSINHNLFLLDENCKNLMIPYEDYEYIRTYYL